MIKCLRNIGPLTKNKSINTEMKQSWRAAFKSWNVNQFSLNEYKMYCYSIYQSVFFVTCKRELILIYTPKKRILLEKYPMHHRINGKQRTELGKWTGTKGGHTSVKHSHGKLFDKISLKTAPLKMCNQSGPQTTDVTMDASRLCCYNYELSLFK